MYSYPRKAYGGSPSRDEGISRARTMIDSTNTHVYRNDKNRKERTKSYCSERKARKMGDRPSFPAVCDRRIVSLQEREISKCLERDAPSRMNQALSLQRNNVFNTAFKREKKRKRKRKSSMCYEYSLKNTILLENTENILQGAIFLKFG